MYPLGLEPRLDGVGGRNVIQLHYEYILYKIVKIRISVYPTGWIFGCMFFLRLFLLPSDRQKYTRNRLFLKITTHSPLPSEALMVSNSTTGTNSVRRLFYFTLFCFLFASDYAIIFSNFRKNIFFGIKTVRINLIFFDVSRASGAE